jgi:hypothetical protein
VRRRLVETWDLLADVYDLMIDRLTTIGDDEAATFVITELGAHLLRRLWHFEPPRLTTTGPLSAALTHFLAG